MHNEVCGDGDVTCTKGITTTIGFTKVELDADKNVTIYVNGIEQKNASLPFENGDMNVHEANEDYVQIDMKNNVTLMWDGRKVATELPEELFRPAPDYKTLGLLGTWNNNTKDDLMLPNGTITEDVNVFGNAWVVPGSCKGISINTTHLSVLQKDRRQRMLENSTRVAKAEEQCGVLRTYVFQGCSDEHNRNVTYNACLEDVTTCEQELSKCLCPALETFADECQQMEQTVGDWRIHVSNCRKECTNGEIYQQCGNSCNNTCQDIRDVQVNGVQCKQECVEGCRCPLGMAKQRRGAESTCILNEDCTCIYSNKEYGKGEVVSLTEEGKTRSCTCHGGIWDCKVEE